MLAFEAFYKGYFAAVPFHPEDDPQSGFSRGGDTKNVIGRLGKTDGFNHESRISTWVFGIAYHKALKLISKDVHHGTGVDVDELAETPGDPAPNPAQNYEDQDWLSAALASLSPEQRAVMELMFYYELPYQDIAKILGCPDNTVKTRMFNARKKLQGFAETQEH